MKPRLIAKNASIELLAGDMTYDLVITAKNVFSNHAFVDQYCFDYYLKAILVRGFNSTANGSLFLNLQGVEYGLANPTSVYNTSKIYGSEISHLILPNYEVRTNTETIFWDDVDTRIAMAGAIQARIDNTSTWTGEITLKFIYTRDNNYEF